jgi:hypothetical protein
MVVAFLGNNLIAQNGNEIGQIDTKIDSLARIESILLDKLKEIRTELARLKSKKENLKTDFDSNEVVVVSMRRDGFLLDQPLVGKILRELKQGTKVNVIGYERDNFFRVKVESDFGFMSYTFINRSQILDDLKEKGELKNNKLSLASRKQALIKKYGHSNTAKILDNKIWIGMTPEMAIESWGRPKYKNRTTFSGGEQEQWVYSKAYLYFENGILTSWQDQGN